MNSPRAKPLLVFVFMLVILFSDARADGGETALPGEALKGQLARLLAGGNHPETLPLSHPLSPLRSHPMLATASFLLMEDDPQLLRKHYPEISRAVRELFADSNTASQGLVRGMPWQEPDAGRLLSPGFNSLAALELYSLHLIAWKTGAFEDALECLAWSENFASLVTRSFYDPRRQCFYPLGPDARLHPAQTPGQLLPLVLDRSLGENARGRILDSYRSASARPASPSGKALDPLDPWDNPAMRFLVLGLLSTVMERDREPYLGLRAAAEESAPRNDSAGAAWSDFWRENPSFGSRLFPPWRPISTLVNITLLFERDKLVQTNELAGLRSGIDSLLSFLSQPGLEPDAHAQAIAAANTLLTRVARFSSLLAEPKERWRIIDEGKWLRLSPRIKRLITEGLPASLTEIVRSKAILTDLLGPRGFAFHLDLPERPISAGAKVEFTASLSSYRDTIAASRLYLQIGDIRWKMAEPSEVVTLIPGGTPFTYSGAFSLAPTMEPGIVTLPASIDFVRNGRRIELHRIESVVVTKEYDVALNMPRGRKLDDKPLPVEITLTYSPNRDVQGTVEGTFLREVATVPPLPSRFLVSKGTEKTDLTLAIEPKGPISPGRYPFSLTVSLEREPIAVFEETFVRPFRWLHLGTLAESADVLKNAFLFQADLVKSYADAEGAAVRWSEVPPPAIDGEGSLRLRRLYGKTPGRCALLYTAVEAPSRMKLMWKLKTRNPASLWVNSELIVSGGDARDTESSGPIDLRKGSNSFLIAVCWKDDPGEIVFDLSDESGLPAAGLGNDLETIIEGYERLSEKREETQRVEPPAERLREVVLSYVDGGATEVAVIGSFNNWDPAATPMKREGESPWKARLFLHPGRYTYKFLVNRKSKIVDPSGAATEPDGFGGYNSVLVVP